MPSSLLSKILHPPNSDDTWQQLSSIVLHRTLLIGFVVILGLIISLFFTPIVLEWVRLLIIAAWLMVCFVLFLNDKFHMASFTLVWGSWVMLAIISITGAGIYANTYWIMIFMLVIGGVLVDTREFMLMVAITIVHSVILYLATIQGITRPVTHPSSPIFSWILSVGLLLTISYTVYTVKRTLLKSIDQLRSERAFYRTIVDDQTEYIVRWKADGTRTFVNEAYCRYYDFSREEAIGSDIYRHMTAENIAILKSVLENLTPETPIRVSDVYVTRPDGKQVWQQWSDRALYDDNGQLTEYQSVGRDITASKELEAKKQELYLAQERENFLRDFLNTVTHDLKTPLSVMRTSTYLIKKKKTPQVIDEQSQIVDVQIGKLSRMIDDILTTARLEQVPKFDMQPIEVSDILDETLRPLYDYANSENIIIEKTPFPDVQIIADRVELTRAITNLIENGIKYTPNGGTVSISCEYDQESVRVIIRDTGIGIDQDDLSKIFDRFYRTDNAKNFENGTGLGLAIVYRILEYHAATITVESEINLGTTFVLTFVNPLTSSE